MCHKFYQFSQHWIAIAKLYYCIIVDVFLCCVQGTSGNQWMFLNSFLEKNAYGNCKCNKVYIHVFEFMSSRRQKSCIFSIYMYFSICVLHHRKQDTRSKGFSRSNVLFLLHYNHLIHILLPFQMLSFFSSHTSMWLELHLIVIALW